MVEGSGARRNPLLPIFPYHCLPFGLCQCPSFNSPRNLCVTLRLSGEILLEGALTAETQSYAEVAQSKKFKLLTLRQARAYLLVKDF